MLAKGNRSKAVTTACKTHGGFYLGSIGGPAAILAKNCIKKMEVQKKLVGTRADITTRRDPLTAPSLALLSVLQVLEYAELGMEAVWKIEVEDFPAFVVVDDKGNDFFKKWSH